MDTLVFQNVIVSIVLGFLIGLQREMHILYDKRQKHFAGARTFALICLLGYLSAWLSVFIPYLLHMVIGILGTLLVSAYYRNYTPIENGMTTEFSALVTFLIGAFLVHESIMLSVFMAIMVLSILNLKEKIQYYETVIEKKDLSAAILFLMMSFVILPLLPDKAIDPWNYVNLYKIWLMVVLVAGISFVGYIAVRFVGTKHGIGLAGFFGGLASSTAVTLSFSRQCKENPLFTKNFAIGICLACSMMLLRVFIEMYVINPTLAQNIFIPVLIATFAGFIFIGILYLKTRKEAIVQEMHFKNPFNLSEALILGLLFGAILALITYANSRYGDSGILIVAFISGLSDTDAIAISLASFAKTGILTETILNALMLAIIANSIVKVALIFFLSNRVLGLYVSSYLGITISVFSISYYLGIV